MPSHKQVGDQSHRSKLSGYQAPWTCASTGEDSENFFIHPDAFELILIHLFFQVISSHLTFLPHIREAARDVISELHIASQLADYPKPPFFVGVHVR